MVVRFVVLLLDRWWGQERAIRNLGQEETHTKGVNRSSPRAATVKRVA